MPGIRSLKPRAYVITVITTAARVCAVSYGLVRQEKRTHAHTRARASAGSRRETRSLYLYAPVCAVLSFPLSSKGQECAYISPERERPRAGRKGREGEELGSKGSTPGMGSIARTRTCARARASTLPARACICARTRYPLRRVRAAAAAAAARLCALASIKAVRCLPRRGRRDSNLLGSRPLRLLRPPGIFPSLPSFPRDLPASQLASTPAATRRCIIPVRVAIHAPAIRQLFRARSDRADAEPIFPWRVSRISLAPHSESAGPMECLGFQRSFMRGRIYALKHIAV